jgi:hypothetical protein
MLRDYLEEIYIIVLTLTLVGIPTLKGVFI